MADIEKNLREIAKAKGLKLSDIAARMGTTVSNLLTSVKGNPTVSKIQDIAEALGMTQSAISHQLRILKNARLVKARRDGKTVIYSLADDHVRTIIGQGREHIEE